MQIYFNSRPLLIFIKGANISAGHCMYVCMYVFLRQSLLLSKAVFI